MAILVLVPAVLAAALLLARRVDLPWRQAAPAREGMTALDTWPNGKARVLARESTEAGRAVEELCFYDAEGVELGCGVRHDGTPWSGTFIEWHLVPAPTAQAPSGPAPLKEVRSFREGRREGTWRSYRPDGSVAVEIVYKDDLATSRRIFTIDGNEILEGAPIRPAVPLPVSRRTRSTPQQ